MKQITAPKEWRRMRTDETRELERLLRRRFPRTDAYRYNSASIRIRVIDDRFKGKSRTLRDSMVEPLLDKLDPATQADITNLLTITKEEMGTLSRGYLRNLEFEN